MHKPVEKTLTLSIDLCMNLNYQVSPSPIYLVVHAERNLPSSRHGAQYTARRQLTS